MPATPETPAVPPRTHPRIRPLGRTRGRTRPGLHLLTLAAVTALTLGTVTGCGGAAGARDRTSPPPATTAAKNAPAAAPTPAAETLPRQLPGLGARTLADVPGNAGQVVVVTGADKNSPRSEAVLYERSPAGWRAGGTWAAHNALRGWTDNHHAGDLRSPIGVFGLTDAGGRRGDPGTKLPYDRSGAFTIGGTGFEGEPLAGSFDYVVAINYNRRPGLTPLDWTRPLGDSKGGGIWFHVDHGGPTHGCVSLSEAHMKDLLRTLDPALHPVVVMGDATSLAR
ncbi:L,D-transpeptidase family protein [Streptomyces liangshanensis]|uniref:L,D-transpeptidase family protein n=1 Tax=Streptomyces liangshanensis TaxID=2717324 RepID=UPI0036D8B021